MWPFKKKQYQYHVLYAAHNENNRELGRIVVPATVDVNKEVLDLWEGALKHRLNSSRVVILSWQKLVVRDWI